MSDDSVYRDGYLDGWRDAMEAVRIVLGYESPESEVEATLIRDARKYVRLNLSYPTVQRCSDDD